MHAHVDLLLPELLQDRLALPGREVARVRARDDGLSAPARGPQRVFEELEEAHEPRRRLGRLREHERVRHVARVHEVEEHERLRRRLAHQHVFLPPDVSSRLVSPKPGTAEKGDAR